MTKESERRSLRLLAMNLGKLADAMIVAGALCMVLPVLITVAPKGIPRLRVASMCLVAVGVAYWLLSFLARRDNPSDLLQRVCLVAVWCLLAWILRHWIGV